MISFRVSIAGIGNVGTHVIENLSKNEKVKQDIFYCLRIFSSGMERFPLGTRTAH